MDYIGNITKIVSDPNPTPNEVIYRNCDQDSEIHLN